MGSCQETNDHEAVDEGWIVQREGAPGWSCETHHRLGAVQKESGRSQWGML